MDFLEFLKSGSISASWKIVFDGKSFKRDYDKYPQYVVDSSGRVREQSEYGVPTQYVLEKENSGYYSYYNISKDDDYNIFSKWSIEVNSSGYVTLRYERSKVNIEDDLPQEATTSSNRSSYDDTTFNSDNWGWFDILLGLFIPPTSILRFSFNSYHNETGGNGMHLGTSIFGLIMYIVYLLNFINETFAIRGMPILVIYVMSIFAVAYLINIIVFIVLNTNRVKFIELVLSNKRAIIIPYLIYCCVYILSFVLLIYFLR